MLQEHKIKIEAKNKTEIKTKSKAEIEIDQADIKQTALQLK